MTVEGMDRLRARFRALPKVVRGAVRDEMERIATAWVAQMRRLAPKDTGELAASIGWTWGAAPSGSIAVGQVGGGANRITIYAGNDATMVTNSRGIRFQKAKLQEFGTKAMPANPFFFPVIRGGKRTTTRRINAAAVKAARQIWGK